MPAESLPSPKSSRRTPGSRARGALGGDQRDMEPPEALRHGWCCPFKRAEHGAGGEAAALRSAWAEDRKSGVLGPTVAWEFDWECGTAYHNAVTLSFV